MEAATLAQDAIQRVDIRLTINGRRRDLSVEPWTTLLDLLREEVRELMSGNLCRCGAYTNIADAVLEVMEREGAR